MARQDPLLGRKLPNLGWPESTPEYLLRGYLRMLRSYGDLPRMVALSTDVMRLDRMLDLSGGDAAAIAEIAAVQGYNRDQSRPDLGAAVRLAYARTDLIRRNSNIPVDLPGAWAFLGNLNRADALTQSIDDPGNRALALASLSQAVAETGGADHAARLLDDAEITAYSITSPLGQSHILASLCAVIIETGDLQRAENMNGSISDPGWKDCVLAELAAAYAETGDAERATSIAMSSSGAAEQASALASVAQVFVNAGDLDRARLLAVDAETIARSAVGTRRQQAALASAARAARDSRGSRPGAIAGRRRQCHRKIRHRRCRKGLGA